jgi:hypothetical protein
VSEPQRSEQSTELPPSHEDAAFRDEVRSFIGRELPW